MQDQLIDHKNITKTQRLTLAEKYIYQYPGKVNVSIHDSVLSKQGLCVWRIIAFTTISLRMWFVLQEYTFSFFDLWEYLTNFGFANSWLYFSSVCFDMLFSINCLGITCQFLPDLVSVLYETAFCLQLPITLLYWVILYDPASGESGIQLVKDIGVHGFPFFCLLVDFIFNVYQFPLRHLSAVLTVAFGYLIINLTYSLETTPIYVPIDWKSTGSYVWVVLALSSAISIFILSRLTWVYLRRERVQNRLSQSVFSTHQFYE